MKGQLLLLDVTEMSGSNVCIAGIDLNSGQQVRLNEPQPTRALVRRLRLRTGDVVELEYEFVRRAAPPHVEDARWTPEKLRTVQHYDVASITAAIRPHAFRSVTEAFAEPALRSWNGNSAWAPGSGARSLATVHVRYVRTSISEGGGVRAALRDGDGVEHYFASTPFQDLTVKLHPQSCDACAGPRRAEVVQREFDANGAFVRVGLTRPYSPGRSEPERCWLQVTNIFARERVHFV